MDDNDLKLKDNPVIADFQDYVQNGILFKKRY